MLAPRAVKRKVIAGKAAAKPSAPSETTADQSMLDMMREEEEYHRQCALNAQELDKLAQSHASTSKAVEVQVEEVDPAEVAKLHAEKLSRLRAVIEETLSDWGLCHNRELLKRLKSSEDGFVHISNMLAVPAVSGVTTAMADVTEALQAEAADNVELDESGFRIKRVSSVDFACLRATSLSQWGEQTYYLENIPPLGKGVAITKASLKAHLSEMLDTSVEILRLPELYASKDAAGETSSKDVNSAHFSLYGSTAATTRDKKGKGKAVSTDNVEGEEEETPLQRRQRERAYALPKDSGPFKGFAFAVLRDAEKAKTAYERWNWDNKGKIRSLTRGEEHEDEESSSDEAEVDGESETLETQAKPNGHNGQETDADGPEHGLEAKDSQKPTKSIEIDAPAPIRADRSGFLMMPISTFNRLKGEYMAYSRDLTLLREVQAEARAVDKRYRSRSPEPGQKRKRATSPGRWEQKPVSPPPSSDRWVRKPLSPSPERPARTYDQLEEDYAHGCIVFFKRFDPTTKTGTLKALLQAVLESEEIETDKLKYVDHVRAVDSCHIRFADASTATFFTSWFSGKDAKKRLHTKPDSVDPYEAFSYAPASETRTIEAEVMTGIPEKIYWSKVPKHMRQSEKGDEQMLAAEPEETSETAEASAAANGSVGTEAADAVA